MGMLGKQDSLRIFPYSTKHQLCNFGHVSHLPPNHYLLCPNMELGQSIRYIPEETALGRWGDVVAFPALPRGSVARNWTS